MAEQGQSPAIVNFFKTEANWRVVEVEPPKDHASILSETRKPMNKRTALQIVELFDKTGLQGTQEFLDDDDGLDLSPFLSINPTQASALGSYFCAEFYKGQLSKTNTKTLFKFNVSENVVVPVYSLKGYSGGVDPEVITTNDTQIFGALTMAKLTKNAIDAGHKYPMLSVARMHITDDGLSRLGDLLAPNQNKKEKLFRAITAVNMGSCRSNSPFFELGGVYSPEVAAAMRITSMANLKAQSTVAQEILLKQLKTIVAVCQVDLETNFMYDIIDCMGSSERITIDDVKSVIADARAHKRNKRNVKYLSGGETLSGGSTV